MPALVSALNSVDLPTFGRPTIPHLRLIDALVHKALIGTPRTAAGSTGDSFGASRVPGIGLARPRVQDHHRSLHVASGDVAPRFQRARDRFLDQRTIG